MMANLESKKINVLAFMSIVLIGCCIPGFGFSLLPEIMLVIIICYLLVALAIEVGNGRSKKTLALETSNALQHGLGYLIVLYIYYLLFTGPCTIFNGYLHVDKCVFFLKIILTAAARSILVNSEKYIRESSQNQLEYPLVLTLALLFMLSLVNASHLISAFISLVGFSLNLYVIVLFDSTHGSSREAGMKYFYLSAFSSGLMIYGIFLLFFTLGTGQFREMNTIIKINAEIVNNTGTLAHYGILFLLTGVFFKLSAFPGHLWAAEVYEGSPDPVTAFFMVPVKVAVISFTLQLLAVGLNAAIPLW
jgi:NADH-quinone oxidoreductase subunit N